jgi:DNA-binding IclR family transcriptional regulator
MKKTKTAKRAETRQGIQSIEVGAMLLEVLARATGPLTLRDLSSQAKMSPSKAHRYLVSLLRAGLVMQDPISNRYDVSFLSLKLGLAALNRVDLVRFGTEAASWLNSELDTTVMLAVWGNFGPTVIAMYDSSDLMIQNLRVGSVLPLTRSATGRVFLAYMPRKTTVGRLKQEIKGPLAQIPSTRIRSMTDVEEAIKNVRKHRLGTTQGDVVPGQSALAAPIFDHQGRIVAALTVVGASDSVDVHTANSPAEIVLRTADMVSQRLGFWNCQVGASFVEMLESHPDRLPSHLRNGTGVLSELFATANRTARADATGSRNS